MTSMTLPFRGRYVPPVLDPYGVEISEDTSETFSWSPLCEHGVLTAACYARSCRPPTSGGTGGSIKRGGVAPSAEGVEYRKTQNPLAATWVDDEGYIDDVTRIRYKVEANKAISKRLLADAGFKQWCVDNLDKPWPNDDLDFDEAMLAATNLSRSRGYATPRQGTIREVLEAASAQLGLGLSAEQMAARGMTRWSIDLWAKSSGDHKPPCIAMQLATAKVHGLPTKRLTDFVRSSEADGETVLKQARSIYRRMAPLMEAFIRAEYDATQAYLAERGPTQILYRGFAVRRDALDAATTSKGVSVRGNPLSSWSADTETARRFAQSREDRLRTRFGDATGVLLGVEVPNHLIQSTPLTGRGCLTEWEVTVLDGPGVARSLPVQPGVQQ